jgi:hypothetical protein
MKRRDVLTSVFVAGLSVPIIGDQMRGKDEDEGHGRHEHGDHDDRLRNVAVSFGHWNPVAGVRPFDRFTGDPNDRTMNGHQIIPNPVRIRVGDTVSFIISGFHNPQIFGPGTQPTDIDKSNVLVAAPFPPIINDSHNRLFRGLDPRTLGAVQDRVEVVGFNTAGRFLVICGVLPHFFDVTTGNFIMFGFIDVRDQD